MTQTKPTAIAGPLNARLLTSIAVKRWSIREFWRSLFTKKAPSKSTWLALNLRVRGKRKTFRATPLKFFSLSNRRNARRIRVITPLPRQSTYKLISQVTWNTSYLLTAWATAPMNRGTSFKLTQAAKAMIFRPYRWTLRRPLKGFFKGPAIIETH